MFCPIFFVFYFITNALWYKQNQTKKKKKTNFRLFSVRQSQQQIPFTIFFFFFFFFFFEIFNARPKAQNLVRFEKNRMIGEDATVVDEIDCCHRCLGYMKFMRGGHIGCVLLFFFVKIMFFHTVMDKRVCAVVLMVLEEKIT